MINRMVAAACFPGVGDSVSDHVCHVVIGQGVECFLARTGDANEIVSPQQSKVLGNQRLGQFCGPGQCGDSGRPCRKDAQNAQARRRGKHLEQVGGLQQVLLTTHMNT